MKSACLPRVFTRLFLPAAAMFAPLGQAAQTDAADASAVTLKEIEVKAARAKVLGFGAARATNAVDAGAIEGERPAADVLNLIDRLPGVSVTHGDAVGGNHWSTRIYIRGMSTATDGSQIGYMVDQLPNGDSVYGDGQKPGLFVDVENVAAADVGQNVADIASASNSALGGTVHYLTANPRRNPGIRAAWTTGQEALRRGFVRLDSGAPWRGFGAYASYSETSLNSWPGRGSGDFDRRHVDVLALQELPNGLSLRFKGSWNHRDENDYNSVTLADFDANPNSDGLEDAFSVDGVGWWRPSWGGTRWDRAASLQVSGPLAAAGEFSLAPYHHDHKGWGWWAPPFRVAALDGRIEGPQGPREFYAGTFRRDAQGRLIPAPAGVSVASFGCLAHRYEDARVSYAINPAFDCAGAERIATRRRSGYRKSRAGVVWEASWHGERSTFTVGGWSERQRRDGDRRWYNLDPARPGTIHPSLEDLHWLHFDRKYRSSTARFHVQERLRLGRFELSAGMVWHRAETDYASRLDGAMRDQSRAEWLPKLSVVHRLSARAELFAAYSRNVLMLSDELLATGTTDDLAPERSDNLDVGMRWNGARLGLVAQAFAQRFRDRHGAVNLDALGGDLYLQGAVALLNIGGVANRGLEVAAVLDWSEAWAFHASWSHLRSKYTDDVPAEGIAANKTLVNAARHQWFAEVAWRGAAPARRWRLAANAKFVGERPADPANVDALPAHTLFGISARVTFEDAVGDAALTLQLNASNLTDEDYLAAPDGDQGGYFFIGPPRMVSVTVGVEV